jgi:hypothetical protein
MTSEKSLVHAIIVYVSPLIRPLIWSGRKRDVQARLGKFGLYFPRNEGPRIQA